MVVGCGRFDNEYTSIVSSDEVSTLRVSCVNFLGVPTMCAVINETTRTIRIESIVTEIVNRIVKKEVVTEVPIEKIVIRVETRYIVTSKEVDIEEIVVYIIARIKEYVQPTDIIDVPIEDIVDETTESITNAPPPGNTTTLGDIRDEKPDPIPPVNDDTEGTPAPNPEDNGTDGGSNDGGTHKLQVRIGPKSVTSRPSIDQPGLDIRITCQIDGNTIYPSINSRSLFKGDNWKQWGLSVWCQVPSNTNGSDVTIHVNVSDTGRWCGLTTSDVSVSRFLQNPNGSSYSVGSVDALINLSPNPMPVCNNNNAPVFTEGTDITVEEHTASGFPIGDPVSATDEDDDTLEYTLGGTDAGFFSIDSTSGQLSTNAELDDYETKSSYSITVSVSDGNGGTDEITVTIDVKLRKEEFFEVYYAILLEDDYLDVQYYVIRGYGYYDHNTPIYVDNYHLFEGGLSSQTSTGWGSATEAGTIAYQLEIDWKEDYSAEFDYVHGHTKVSVHDKTFDEARREIYQTTCNAAAVIGSWDGYQVGFTYPEIANNTSDDVINLLHLNTISLYFEDDDCNPDN